MKGIRKIGKSLEKSYKSARDNIRKATNSRIGQAATIALDKTTAAAAKNVGLGAAQKLAKNAATSEFSGNSKMRKKAKSNIREFARRGTTGAAKASAAAGAPNA